MEQIKLAVDAMGGENAPRKVIIGCHIALQRYPDLSFLLVGDRKKIEAVLRRFPELAKKSEIIHAANHIDDEMGIAQALKIRRGSSIWEGLQQIKEKKVACFVSAGNTGVLMGFSVLVLKMVKGLQRPCLATLMPSSRGQVVMLDMGANAESSSLQLAQFAVMGSAFSQAITGLKKPETHLVNIGVEMHKGHSQIHGAHQILTSGAADVNYKGYVEADGIIMGKTDVAVCDGFTGNAMLKISEGAGRFVIENLRYYLRSSLLAIIGAIFAWRALKKLQRKLDPRNYNGAVLLGLNGLVVKSHGSADSYSYANAIEVARDLMKANYLTRINRRLQRMANKMGDKISAASEGENQAENKTAEMKKKSA